MGTRWELTWEYRGNVGIGLLFPALARLTGLPSFASLSPSFVSVRVARRLPRPKKAVHIRRDPVLPGGDARQIRGDLKRSRPKGSRSRLEVTASIRHGPATVSGEPHPSPYEGATGNHPGKAGRGR